MQTPFPCGPGNGFALVVAILVACLLRFSHEFGLDAGHYAASRTSNIAGKNFEGKVVLQASKSEDVFKEALNLMPGGVSSPLRAFGSVGGNPIVIDRAKGSKIWDIDGNKYIDYVGSFGTAIVGHANEEVLSTIRSTSEKGTSFGALCTAEIELAKLITGAIPSVEMIRFTNSGTEACLGAMRLARAFTGRKQVIKLSGCYHGDADAFLVKAGSGVATLGLPDSPGVPEGVTCDTLIAKYNDLESVEALMKDGHIAAIFVEPIMGNCGFIPPKKEFLVGLRRLADESGALLVFDEVITGFRIAYGGAQECFGVTADITTLGKVIGGGLPVGAFGGRKEIMEMVAPAGPMYEAGTLSGNPLTMSVGIKTLEIMKRPGNYVKLGDLSAYLVEGILKLGRETGHDICGGSMGGMFGFFFNKGPITSFEEALQSSAMKFSKFHRGMRDRSIYLPPSMYEAWFMNLAHTKDDIDKTISAAREVLVSICKVRNTALDAVTGAVALAA